MGTFQAELNWSRWSGRCLKALPILVHRAL